MRILSNSLGHIIDFFRSELKGLYNDNEINSLMYWTLEHYAKLSKTQLIVQKERRVSESVMLKIKFAINDLKNYRPIQYIIGETEFLNLKFTVNECVLIPRPETEELVNWVLADNNENVFLNILDIGTGSGCIAISISNALKNCNVDGVDISEKAINIAIENNLKNKTTAKFSVFDILDKENWDKIGKYDIIVSNPPYIPEKERALISKNVNCFEPKNALFVPNDFPYIFYEVITDFAFEKLNDNGLIYFEIHENSGNELIKKLKQKKFSKIELRKDLNEKDRMIKIKK